MQLHHQKTQIHIYIYTSEREYTASTVAEQTESSMKREKKVADAPGRDNT
jgi:hypothetical protein